VDGPFCQEWVGDFCAPALCGLVGEPLSDHLGKTRKQPRGQAVQMLRVLSSECSPEKGPSEELVQLCTAAVATVSTPLPPKYVPMTPRAAYEEDETTNSTTASSSRNGMTAGLPWPQRCRTPERATASSPSSLSEASSPARQRPEATSSAKGADETSPGTEDDSLISDAGVSFESVPREFEAPPESPVALPSGRRPHMTPRVGPGDALDGVFDDCAEVPRTPPQFNRRFGASSLGNVSPVSCEFQLGLRAMTVLDSS